MARLDPHSFHDSTQPAATQLMMRARVDFAARVLDAEVAIDFDRAADGPIDLDTRDLEILEITGGDGAKLEWELARAEPILGARLRVHARGERVLIRYRTSPQASALQWLEPAQTGGAHPFLFSQCQAIHARSVVPLQDTPRVRIRYRAELRVPRALKALMAAAFVERREEGSNAVEIYEMPQPIPPYLFALAVGELTSRELGPRSRVWAAPEVVEAAAWEFAAVDDMLRTAEALLGPYEWERFDVLTMPPSFPYGGMENPRLTFLTPTVLAGDRSLVNVLAHELAHSWTGNLVTNANAEHFWLNEGFTVFAERRILEALAGGEVLALHAALGRRELERELSRFAPELTRLRTHLAGVDPDEAFSDVPYEKGYLFLRALEEEVGRARFDQFLRRYVERFRFRSITTEEFCAFADEELPNALRRVEATQWLDGAGLPSSAPRTRSSKLEAIEALGDRAPDAKLAASWSPTEWQLYLASLPSPPPWSTLETIEANFSITKSRNYEVLVTWLERLLEAEHPAAPPRVAEVVSSTGRMKFLKPLYSALAKRDRARAQELFAQNRASYHPIAQQVVEGLLNK